MDRSRFIILSPLCVLELGPQSKIGTKRDEKAVSSKVKRCGGLKCDSVTFFCNDYSGIVVVDTIPSSLWVCCFMVTIDRFSFVTLAGNILKQNGGAGRFDTCVQNCVCARNVES